MRVISALIFSLMFSFSASAQTAETSKLTGTVYDANGAVVVGAKVTAVSTDVKKFGTVSNEEGVYFLTLPFYKYVPNRGFKEAKYDISVERTGFKRSLITGFVFVPSQFGKMTLDIGLEILSASDEEHP